MSAKPLFIALRSEYFYAFRNKSKTEEFRKYGRGWNEKTCELGRAVVLSKGYGKGCRIHGVITGFEKREMSSPEWLACYGKPGIAACIRIEVLG